MEIGLYSFGDRTIEVGTGKLITAHERKQRLLEEIKLADEVGLDVFGIGEHHREDFIVTNPVVILAAAAAMTRRIRLSSAVVVLSSDDPVRVFEQYTQLDLVSNGRAELMVGRGSFIESFPLFGYDLQDYEALFEEKLDLLLQLREKETITWEGRYRPPLNNQRIFPRPIQEKLPIWIAAGGTPQLA
ncbi:MAG: LLM class flavin-dependent oxidoreductase, partial [Bacteroidales bacterium]